MKKEYAKGYETFEDFKEGYKKFIMKLEKMTGQPIEQFVSEYEFYREVIRNSTVLYIKRYIVWFLFYKRLCIS